MRPSPRKEECYFCGRTEDETWLKPMGDGEEYVCEECEAEQEARRERVRPDPYDAWRDRQMDDEY